MRTTVILPDDLMERVKQAARDQGRTMTSFLEDALRRRLEELRHETPRDPFVFEPFIPPDGSGLLPGIDPHDNGSMLDAADGLRTTDDR